MSNHNKQIVENDDSEKRGRMENLCFTASCGFGLFLLFMGIGTLMWSVLAALPLIAMALILLPPVRNFVYSKTNIKIPFMAKAFSIMSLFFLWTILSKK